MTHEKKTLVILAFDGTKTPKKKLKKIQKEVYHHLTCQNFRDFLVLKEDGRSSFVRFDGELKKTKAQIENLPEENFTHYLYINCKKSFFCGDYRFFCSTSTTQANVGISFDPQQAESFSPKRIDKLEIEDLPFRKEKVLYFSKELLPKLKEEKKNPKLIFGTRISLLSNKGFGKIRNLSDLRRPCLFLDRDGIIIKDKKYLSHVKDIEFVDGIFDLVRWANNQKWYVIVLTNQSGIGRGLYSKEDYLRCEKYIEEKFKEQKVLITKTFFSPYHRESSDSEILKEIYTRKPFPGMLLKAAQEFPVDLSKSIMLGDKMSDEFIETSLPTYFLKGEYPLQKEKPSFSCLADLKKELENRN